MRFEVAMQCSTEGDSGAPLISIHVNSLAVHMITHVGLVGEERCVRPLSMRGLPDLPGVA
jgi:hypothetical protein